MTATSRAKPSKPLAFLAWFERHQIPLTSTPLVFLFLAVYLRPPIYEVSTKDTLLPSLRISDRSFAAKFVYLSYYDPAQQRYLKGPDDVFIVIFSVFMLILARVICMKWLFTPFAKYWGIKRHRAAVRFAEQGWSFLYVSIFWSLGVYNMQTSPTRNFNFKNFIIGYPHIHLNATMKWYYLIQTAFWVSQIIILNMEARRKDHVQMFTHHVITVILMVMSLVTNWTLVGNIVMCLMDCVDILLPLAKMLRYLGFEKICDATFGLFVVTWIVSRQILFSVVIWTVFRSHKYVPFRWDPPHGSFYSLYSHSVFICLLSALQVLNCIWLYTILNIVIKVLRGDNATDTRSDDEDGDEEDEDGRIKKE